jgi:hypothetical protein
VFKTIRRRIRARISTALEHRRSPAIRSESLVLETWKGEQPGPSPGGRLAVFAHYDPQGMVDDYVVDYLRDLARLGASTIFVSTSESLTAEEAGRVLPFCSLAVKRRDLGRDFGSWKTGLDLASGVQTSRSTADRWSFRDCRQVILANDSVYALRPLGEIFRSMEGRGLDIWGATSSRELGWHLQSYFLVFEPAALRSPFFEEFWGRFVFLVSRAAIIHYGEFGLTRSARRHGLRLGAYVEAKELERTVRRLRPRHPFARHLGRRNPTIHFWELLLSDFALPFLKTEILRRPGFVAEGAWEAHVPPEHREKIRKHLSRMKPPPAGLPSASAAHFPAASTSAP